MRVELQSYASHHPDVALFDLFEQIGPTGDCASPADGFDESWRYDGVHYTAAGARWVADWLTSLLTSG